MDLAVERAAAQAHLESLVGQLNNVEQARQQLTQQVVEATGVVKWLASRTEPDAPVAPPPADAPTP